VECLNAKNLSKVQINALFKQHQYAWGPIKFEGSEFGNFEYSYLSKYLTYIMILHTKKACN
jgi:hypothetical protein